MSKLKPCPFCGKEAAIEVHGFYNRDSRGFTDKTYGVVCGKCHTSGWQFYENKEKAIEAWNRRMNDGMDQR